MIDYPFNFEKTKGIFLSRENRFLLKALVNGKIFNCHLPNPGRLWELLIPEETELILINNHANPKIPYTVLACKKENRWVLLHTHLTNKIAKRLINEGKISAYRDFRVLASEVKIDHSRFDLLLSRDSEKLYLEVKTCTLFGRKIGMFPDAITERGKRHLLELKTMTEKSIKTSVLFVVMSSEVKFFIPAYHIDFEFAKAFMAVKDSVDLRAIAIEWDIEFTEVKTVKELKIPFSFIETTLRERGAYILIIHLAKDEDISIGELGNLHFSSGFYAYIGRAKTGLFKRIARHRRKIKKMHWHIDYLLNRAKIIRDLPIITEQNIECSLAEKLRKISDNSIPQFGSSDCHCKSHLFYFKKNPLLNKDFIEMINFFRIESLEI
ncbi:MULTISPECIES: DNA/RNA nuclease SfsA [Thermodesulfovibrio]|jgi:sugar fermentation stimulation protein A|uniref:DNA/RNA nuclease SfsA n=1 Tax=Thermodesulfovibrio TaxID=28261 RepID=UPI00262800F4|nr:DNA/RNA nuclease SfsA [Thermodesulfovibrio sp.]